MRGGYRTSALKLGVFALALAALLAVPANTAGAKPFIENQQKEMSRAKQTWEKKTIPQGMQVDAPRDTTPRDSGASAVSMHARNVDFGLVGGIGFYIEDLLVSLDPTDPSKPVVFDDVESFTIHIHRGNVIVRPEALTALFNKHILDYFLRPLDDLQVSTAENNLVADGGLQLWSWFPGFWLPARLSGTIVLSDDNKLVYAPDDVTVFGIPLAGLLSSLGIELSYLLSIDREGAELIDSQLVLDHRAVFPPPAINGNLSEAKLTEQGLHLSFADNAEATFDEPPVSKDSYLWIQSGDPKLFGIVVTNARVQVISDSDDQPLRFNLYDYRKQVAAGVLRMTDDGTIIATLPAGK